MDNTSNLQNILSAIEALLSAQIVTSVLSYSDAEQATEVVDVDALAEFLITSNHVLQDASNITMKSAESVSEYDIFVVHPKFVDVSGKLKFLYAVIHTKYLGYPGDILAPYGLYLASKLIPSLDAATISLCEITASLEDICWSYVEADHAAAEKADQLAQGGILS